MFEFRIGHQIFRFIQFLNIECARFSVEWIKNVLNCSFLFIHRCAFGYLKQCSTENLTSNMEIADKYFIYTFHYNPNIYYEFEPNALLLYPVVFKINILILFLFPFSPKQTIFSANSCVNPGINIKIHT